MFRSLAAYFAPIAFTLLGFGLQPESAAAQTIYPFNATFSGENTVVPFKQNISKVTITASSTDAPYGLTRFVNTNYGLIDPSTGTTVFNPDAATFGLKDLPQGNLTFFGAGNDKLFGNIIGNAKLDFQNLKATATGTFNITGGEGKLAGATGTFNFLENDQLNADPTAPFKSQAVLNGSFTTPKTIPEPGNTSVLIGMGIIGVSLLFSHSKDKSKFA